MGVRNHHQIPTDITDYGVHVRRYSDRLMDSPSPEMVGPVQQKGLVSDWIEVWDYVGGIRFRGFIAEKEEEKAMFVFFDQNVVGGDLKAGYVYVPSPKRTRTNILQLDGAPRTLRNRLLLLLPSRRLPRPRDRPKSYGHSD